MKQFRLHQGSTTIELREGDFVVGRAPECQLSVEDPNVSRRHAAFRVRGEDVAVEDLGSANGVKVNGAKITSARPLNHGDEVAIGGLKFRVSAKNTSGSITQTDSDTLIAASKGIKAPDKLVLAAEQAFASGKHDEGSLFLTRYLARQIRSYEHGEEFDTLAGATTLAIKAATLTGNGSWIDWVLEAHRTSRRVLPIAVVDELFTLVRKVKPAPLIQLRNYVQQLRDGAQTLAPNERFVLQRLEGLLRVAMAG